ncbi:MAG: hypothetical protein K1X74_04555 [Pirellulales bacterium]|nr:hypothetical protein [Pirellulales bacterium]
MALSEIALRIAAHLLEREQVFTDDPVLGWKCLPQARYFDTNVNPYHIATNARGLRDRDYAYEKPADALRVVVLGDSFVFGAGGVEQPELFTEVLESNWPGVEVINMGVIGYSPDQEFLALKTEGIRYQPDVVVLCLFYNDDREFFFSNNHDVLRPKCYPVLADGQIYFEPPRYTAWYPASQRSYFLALLNRASKICNRASAEQRDAEQLAKLSPETRVATWRQYFFDVDAYCREHGAELVVVYFPLLHEFADRHGFIHRLDPEMRQVADQLSQNLMIRFLDLSPRLWQASARQEYPVRFPNDCHLTPYGHWLTANELASFLMGQTSLGRRCRVPPSIPPWLKQGG